MNELITSVLVALGPAVGGWLNNALKDGSISVPEWKQLLETVISTAVYGSLVFFGASSFGVDVTLVSGAVAGAGVNIIMRLIKSFRKT